MHWGREELPPLSHYKFIHGGLINYGDNIPLGVYPVVGFDCVQGSKKIDGVTYNQLISENMLGYKMYGGLYIYYIIKKLFSTKSLETFEISLLHLNR